MNTIILPTFFDFKIPKPRLIVEGNYPNIFI